MDAVILAGGRGTRLRPFTVSIPKPLVPLGDQPIIEILLRQLVSCGISRVHVTLGHLAELLEAYFGQAQRRLGIPIEFTHEDKPLGTVGPITLIKDLRSPFLLLNGDILTTLPFTKLVEWHSAQGSIATLAVHKRHVPIDYGVVDVSPEGIVAGHREKPSLDVTVGMGICVLEPSIVDYIPRDTRFDIPDLVHTLLDRGERIAAYTSEDYWMDIGRPDDYEVAHHDYTTNPSRFHPSTSNPESGERRDW